MWPVTNVAGDRLPVVSAVTSSECRSVCCDSRLEINSRALSA